MIKKHPDQPLKKVQIIPQNTPKKVIKKCRNCIKNPYNDAEKMHKYAQKILK